MSKKHIKKKMTISAEGIAILKIVSKQINEYETIVKAHASIDPSVHLGLVQKSLGFEPHLTDEREPDREKAHKYYRLITIEEFLNSFMILLSRPGSPPPKITSVNNKKDMERMNLYFKKSLSRFIHPPKHRKAMVLKSGPLRDAIMPLLNQEDPDNLTFEIDEFINRKDKRVSKNQKYEWKFEDEIKPKNLELAFLNRPDRTLLVFSEGFVIEFYTESFDRWQRSLTKLPGVKELLKEINTRTITCEKHNES
ncbi:MAG: hypothetical protein KKE24_00850 [Candidatus Thermoplasmatota archaeon]|nr:hypothetical protein [Candidatus Thermoplasmatota archaeon]